MSVTRYGSECYPGGRSFGPKGMDWVTPEPTHACECHQRPSPVALWQQAEREHPDAAGQEA